MNHEGFRTIQTALEAAGVAAQVEPVPEAGEHVEFVTMTSDPTLPPAALLNALARARLLAKTAGQQAADQERHRYSSGYASSSNPKAPKLELLASQPGSATFVDANNGY